MTVLDVSLGNYTELDKYGTLTTRGSDGPVQARNFYFKDTPYRRGWRLGSDGMSSSDFSALLAILDETLGGAGIFQWTPRGGSQVDVQFVPGSFDWVNVTRHRVAVEFAIEKLRPGS